MTVSLGATLSEELGIDVLSLLVFARIVESGGIAAAAAELQLSRSAASKRLAELERRLGTRLLSRTTRRLTPTEAGEAVLRHCENVASEIRAAADAVGELAGGDAKGLLRVACPPTLGRLMVLPRLGAFLERHPGISLRLMLTDLPFEDIARKVDVAVRLATGVPLGFVARTVCEVSWLLVAAPGYLARRPAPARPEDVLSHDCVALGGIPWPIDWVFTRRGQRRSMRVRARFQANNFDAVRSLAEQGMGLALMPAYAIGEPLEDGRLVAVLSDYTVRLPGADRVSVVYAPPTAAAPRLRAFLAFLAECLAEPRGRARSPR